MLEQPERRRTLLVLGFVVGSSALAGVVLLRGGARAPAPRTRVFDRPEAQLRDPSMIGQAPDSKSSYDLVQRTQEMAKGDSSPEAPGGSAAQGRNSSDGQSPTPAPAAGLSASEKAQLLGLAGDLTDPKKAAELGAGAGGLWMNVMKALGRHPHVLSFVLNNDMVVKAFMSRPECQRYCGSAGAFKSYLMDLKSPTGVTHDMGVFGAVVHGDPGTPAAVFGSKLADTMMSCPSGQTLLHDRASIVQIAQANPGLVQMTLDPTVMLGIASNQTVSATFQKVQSSMQPAPEGR